MAIGSTAVVNLSIILVIGAAAVSQLFANLARDVTRKFKLLARYWYDRLRKRDCSDRLKLLPQLDFVISRR